ncbi:helix-turn-helix transcriptional regulator, partial [Pseudomonas aeruginosa]
GQLSAHLAAAVSANQIRTLVALRESLERQALAMAVCDRYGVLHCAERGFVDLLLGAWPGWTGPQLPEETSPQGYRDARLVIDSRQVGDLYLLTARQPSAIEQLSNREGDVALLFSEGKTYKQIARDLGLAPNTVRHHIRTIYSKLGVNDKASIAHLLHQFPPG